MPFFKRSISVSLLGLMLTSCATTEDIERLEFKIDRIFQATQRSSLEQIFGDQTADISERLKTLDDSQATRFEALQQSYVSGALSLEETRSQMMNVLGNNHRIVTASSGIYVRKLSGERLKAIPNGAKLTETAVLRETQIPQTILGNPRLNQFTWASGRLDGEEVMFPWELTMSTFTREIVENTARRTAEEFIRMGGEKAWNRPVIIEVSIKEDQQVDLSTRDSESDIFVHDATDDSFQRLPLE